MSQRNTPEALAPLATTMTTWRRALRSCPDDQHHTAQSDCNDDALVKAERG